MWYFLIRATPKFGVEATRTGGAFINCWINFPIEDGAKHLAEFYVEQAGWAVDATEESRWVQRETNKDDSDGLRYFMEAETEGASLVFNQWPGNGEDED